MKLLSLELETESTSEELENKMVVDENVYDENGAREKPSSDVISDLSLSSVDKRNLTAGKSDPFLLFNNYILVFDEGEGQGEFSEDESLPEAGRNAILKSKK